MIRRFICHSGKIDLWISVARSWRAVDSSKTWGWVTLGCLWERSSSLLPSSLSFTARSFRRTAIFSSAVSSYILFQWPCFAFIFVFYFLCRSFFWLSRDLSHVASVRLLKTLQATKICERGLRAQAEGTTKGLCGQGDGANEKNETFDSSISLLFHVNFLFATNWNAGLSYCFIEILCP